MNGTQFRILTITDNYKYCTMAPSDMSFVPQENVPRTFGRQTVYVYPEIAPDMSYSEKSYGFMVTKAAWEAAGIPFDQMLQILAGITRTAPLVSVLPSKFVDFATIKATIQT